MRTTLPLKRTEILSDITFPLLTWYKSQARALPWREEPTPYRVWISEIMLQQTRTEAVKPYFNSWMERFPTIHDLAEAEEADVLHQAEQFGAADLRQQLGDLREHLHRVENQPERGGGHHDHDADQHQDPGDHQALPCVHVVLLAGPRRLSHHGGRAVDLEHGDHLTRLKPGLLVERPGRPDLARELDPPGAAVDGLHHDGLRPDQGGRARTLLRRLVQVTLGDRPEWREDAIVAHFNHEIRPQLDAAELAVAPLLEIGGEHRIPAALWERLRANFAV